MKRTVVIGASTNPERYSNKAVIKLQSKGHEVIPVGLKNGVIDGTEIVVGKPQIKDVDTVSLYVGAKNQHEYYDYIFSLAPKRIIFNPGAENKEFFDLAVSKNIEAVEACTLVMLSIGNF